MLSNSACVFRDSSVDVGSSMAKRSPLLEQARFFFEPVELGRQPANLAVQFVNLALVFGLPGAFPLVLILEQLGQVFQRLFLPAIQHVRMHPVFGGKLVDRFFFFQGFQRDLRLLAGGEVFSRGHDMFSLHLIFARFRVQFSLAT